mmetsp:Transcript_18056/g.36007  ORF Transcript_18056/g.36007 Transcript_18056/m.36007 type:complete len:348 (+) Transcript_18056:1916-2959(+)
MCGDARLRGGAGDAQRTGAQRRRGASVRGGTRHGRAPYVRGGLRGTARDGRDRSPVGRRDGRLGGVGPSALCGRQDGHPQRGGGGDALSRALRQPRVSRVRGRGAGCDGGARRRFLPPPGRRLRGRPDGAGLLPLRAGPRDHRLRLKRHGRAGAGGDGRGRVPAGQPDRLRPQLRPEFRRPPPRRVLLPPMPTRDGGARKWGNVRSRRYVYERAVGRIHVRQPFCGGRHLEWWGAAPVVQRDSGGSRRPPSPVPRDVPVHRPGRRGPLGPPDGRGTSAVPARERLRVRGEGAPPLHSHARAAAGRTRLSLGLRGGHAASAARIDLRGRTRLCWNFFPREKGRQGGAV